MSYLPFRDNPDARIPNLALRDQLVALAEQIDLSSRTSAHEDSCGCKDGPKCTFRSWHETHEADTAEALAWMWNKGLLKLPSTRFAPSVSCVGDLHGNCDGAGFEVEPGRYVPGTCPCDCHQPASSEAGAR